VDFVNISLSKNCNFKVRQERNLTSSKWFAFYGLAWTQKQEKYLEEMEELRKARNVRRSIFK